MAVEGKYKLYNEGGFFYKYRLVASNGQPLIISEPYKDEKACRAGIETLKKNIDSVKIDFEKDKNKMWCFRIITAQGRPLAQSANYKTKKLAESASGSYQRFVGATAIELDDAESKHFNVEILQEEVETNDKGKFIIVSDEKEGDNYYQLIANNGQVLCVSQAYMAYDSCKKAIDSFRKAVYEGNFYIFIDKQGKAFFKLYSKQLRLVMTGETYDTKKQAFSAAKSVLKFAKDAKFVEAAKK